MYDDDGDSSSELKGFIEKILVSFDSGISDESIEKVVGELSEGCEFITNTYDINSDLPSEKKKE